MNNLSDNQDISIIVVGDIMPGICALEGMPKENLLPAKIDKDYMDIIENIIMDVSLFIF